MGKASSAKKVARAARTGGGRTRRGSSSWVWPTLMSLVVILGTAGIVYSRDQRQPDNSRPLPAGPGRPVDHWHAAIGFYLCGEFAPDLPEGTDPLGIHGHGDNVVHVHPFGASSAGKRARLGIFFETVEAEVSDDHIELPGQDRRRNGDKCGERSARVQAKVWDSRDPADLGRVVPGDPSSIRPQDGQLITIAFVPDGDDIPRPPSADNLDRLTDLGPQPTESTSSTTPTSTSTPADPNASTTTTGASTSTTTP